MECFSFAYITVGGVQALSIIVNLFLPRLYRTSGRKYLECFLVILISSWYIIMVTLSVGDVFATLYLFTLLFITPFAAMWYGYISWAEIRIIKRYADRKKYVLTN